MCPLRQSLAPVLLSAALAAAALAPVPAAATASAEAQALRGALAEMRAGDWEGAADATARAGDVAQDVITWNRLRQGGLDDFAAYRDFLARRSDWPGLDAIRIRGETAILENADPRTVVAYFDGRLPETGIGVVRLVEAYRALGREGDAQALAVEAWRSRTLSPDTEAELLDRYGPLLKKHNTARLDNLLWRGQEAAVLRMLPRVPEDWQKLAQARLALADRAPGVDTRVAAVPKALQNDAGLAFERFSWRAAKGRHAEAIALLAERSRSPELLGRPEAWANWRRIYARRLMREGAYDEAYTLASMNFLVEGSDFADLEWLSGYIALRYLDDPELALVHFNRMHEEVESPISLGRAGYWKGRALTAKGDTAAAEAAYRAGAKNQSSFYGLLAAEALGEEMDPTLAGTETFPPVSKTVLAQSSVLQAGLLLLDAGDKLLAERFLTHLVEGQPRAASGAVAQMMLDRGETHIALMIAKRAATEGVVLPAAYFPLSPLMKRDLPVPQELALAIARRESEFDPEVVSPAGARGLMQLMPGTAEGVAGKLGLPYGRDRLTADPGYNVQLGSAYLAGLVDRFGPAPVLVAVGYNAGPSRAVDWSAQFGDPRRGDVDVVDWIELIPFRETQNYVMRVTESVMVYRARLSGKTGKVTMTDYLRGG